MGSIPPIVQLILLLSLDPPAHIPQSFFPSCAFSLDDWIPNATFSCGCLSRTNTVSCDLRAGGIPCTLSRERPLLAPAPAPPRCSGRRVEPGCCCAPSRADLGSVREWDRSLDDELADTLDGYVGRMGQEVERVD